MRGLTSEEYAGLLQAAEYRGCAPSEYDTAHINTDDENNIMDSLSERGLIDEVECACDEEWAHDTITALGREALRLYQALRAMQVSL